MSARFFVVVFFFSIKRNQTDRCFILASIPIAYFIYLVVCFCCTPTQRKKRGSRCCVICAAVVALVLHINRPVMINRDCVMFLHWLQKREPLNGTGFLSKGFRCSCSAEKSCRSAEPCTTYFVLESAGTCDRSPPSRIFSLKILVRHLVSLKEVHKAAGSLCPDSAKCQPSSDCSLLQLDAMVSSALIMWGYSNMETLSDSEMLSAFSAFLLGLINSENTGGSKAGVRRDRAGFSAALDTDGLPEYELWLEIISHRCWEVSQLHLTCYTGKWSLWHCSINTFSVLSGLKSYCFANVKSCRCTRTCWSFYSVI